MPTHVLLPDLKPYPDASCRLSRVLPPFIWTAQAPSFLAPVFSWH